MSKATETLDKLIQKEADGNVSAVARKAGMSTTQVHLLCRDKRNFTVESSARLGKVFGKEPLFFLMIQIEEELDALKGPLKKVKTL